MNGKLLGLTIGIAIVALLTIRSRPKSVKVGATKSSAAAKIDAPAARKVVAPPIEHPTRAVAPERRAHFNTPEEIKKLQSVVIDVSDTIDPDKRSEAFRRSGLDTAEHLASAISIVKEDYAEPLDDKAVYLRLLALHYLGLTSRLDIDGCKALVGESFRKYAARGNTPSGKPYLWDARDLAQICTRIDSRAMVEYQQSATNPVVAAQLKHVLETEGVL